MRILGDTRGCAKTCPLQIRSAYREQLGVKKRLYSYTIDNFDMRGNYRAVRPASAIPLYLLSYNILEGQ